MSHPDSERHRKPEIATASSTVSNGLRRGGDPQPTSITGEEAELLAKHWTQLLVDARAWVFAGTPGNWGEEMCRYAGERLNVLVRSGLVAPERLRAILSRTDAGTSTGHAVLLVPVATAVRPVNFVNERGDCASLSQLYLALLVELLRRSGERSVAGALHPGHHLNAKQSAGLAGSLERLTKRIDQQVSTAPPFEVKQLGDASSQELIWSFGGDAIMELDALHDICTGGAVLIEHGRAGRDHTPTSST